jgi:hypothetical protein
MRSMIERAFLSKHDFVYLQTFKLERTCKDGITQKNTNTHRHTYLQHQVFSNALTGPLDA